MTARAKAGRGRAKAAHAHAHAPGLRWRETRSPLETARWSAAEQLADVARLVRFVDEERFAWDAAEYKARANPEGASPGYPAIVKQVADLLYYQWYLQPDGGHGSGVVLADPVLEHTLARRIGDAIASKRSWAGGWTRVGDEADRVRVRNHAGAESLVSREDVRSAGPDTLVRVEPGLPTAQPGWYHVRGETDYAAGYGETLRVYWNVCAAGAVPLVRAVSARLDGAGIPFRLKVVSDPQKYTRADAGVLYLPRGAWAEAAPRLAEAYADVSGYAKASPPRLTKRLARGLGVADDPGGGASYGQHRCLLVAEGLWDARAASAPREEALAFVRRRFERARVDPDQPWLAPGSPDYDCPVPDFATPFHGGLRA